jgi:pimeloyl-ACP methyl ester carboxylesterase
MWLIRKELARFCCSIPDQGKRRSADRKHWFEPPGFTHTGRKMLEPARDRILASLDSIEVPTLILCGEFDQSNLAATDALASKIPGAERVILKGLAVYRISIDRSESNASVRSFLDRVRRW